MTFDEAREILNGTVDDFITDFSSEIRQLNVEEENDLNKLQKLFKEWNRD